MMLLLVACAPTEGADADPCDVAGAICTVAGTGTLALGEDGASATESPLYWPSSLRWHPDGRLLILDFNTNLLRTLEPDGTLGTLAGNGELAYSEVGVPALESPFEHPVDFDALPDGRIVLAVLHESRLRRIDADGMLEAFAGSGVYGYAGDGGEATRAQLSTPWAIAARADGVVWLADGANHVIRVVTDDGTIDTFAGTGAAGYSGDGGPAAEATFWCPGGLWVADDALYVADTANHAIRRIDLASGVVETVAGTGEAGLAGDGGAATDARLQSPRGGVVGPDGALWIADTENDAIRRVDADGTITTVAGNGYRGYAGDGGPAADASLNLPRSLLFDAEGNLFVADMGNGTVRRIAAAAPSTHPETP